MIECNPDTITAEAAAKEERKVRDLVERYIQQKNTEKITIEQSINSESDLKFASKEELDGLTQKLA